MPYKQYADRILEIAKKAGDIIMEYYEGKIEVTIKEDESPVTLADLAANKYICAELARLSPGIPVVSEENTLEDNIKASENGLFWLVDPLDGTKSFIKKSGQFTVNIALIEKDKPIGGAIYVPVDGNSYFVGKDGSAYKQIDGQAAIKINVRKPQDSGLIVVASQSHRTPETDEYINKLKNVSDLVSASSSLKFCLVAEGAADIYPRFGRTMEWDTGAGHAILVAAGGVMENIDGTPFKYCKEIFANPYFIARA